MRVIWPRSNFSVSQARKSSSNSHQRGFLFAGRLAISVCRLERICRTRDRLCTIWPSRGCRPPSRSCRWDGRCHPPHDAEERQCRAISTKNNLKRNSKLNGNDWNYLFIDRTWYSCSEYWLESLKRELFIVKQYSKHIRSRWAFYKNNVQPIHKILKCLWNKNTIHNKYIWGTLGNIW